MKLKTTMKSLMAANRDFFGYYSTVPVEVEVEVVYLKFERCSFICPLLQSFHLLLEGSALALQPRLLLQKLSQLHQVYGMNTLYSALFLLNGLLNACADRICSDTSRQLAVQIRQCSIEAKKAHLGLQDSFLSSKGLQCLLNFQVVLLQASDLQNVFMQIRIKQKLRNNEDFLICLTLETFNALCRLGVHLQQKSEVHYPI